MAVKSWVAPGKVAVSALHTVALEVVGHGAELAGRKHECSGAVRHALVGHKVSGLKGRQQRGTADLGQPSASCKN
jgi:hypothetical protein